MTKNIIIATSVLGLMLAAAAPPAAEAQVRWGARAGAYTDVGEPFIGVEALTRLGATQWFFNPNLEWVLVRDGRMLTLNGDFHYDLPVPSPTFVWVGGGPAVLLSQPPGIETQTDIGINVLGGIGWQVGRLVPYFQGKMLITENRETSIAFGLRF